MSKVNVIDLNGKKVNDLEINEAIWNIEEN